MTVASTPEWELDPGRGRTRADDGRRTSIVSSAGAVLSVAVHRWFDEPSPAEHALLRLAVGPVLDIGCGPGRHVLALASAAIPVLGIDISSAFLAVARRDGANVLRRSVFDDVPDAGEWRTALLLDGNLGLGGDPVALLRRTRDLLAPGGRILLEAQAPGSSSRSEDVHVLLDAKRGPIFTWGSVPMDRVAAVASDSRLTVVHSWSAEGRWFARLDRD